MGRDNCVEILVVDDDDDYNFLTEDAFASSGMTYELTFKFLARDALDFLEEATRFPDLILLDINMPIMTGWEFLEEYEARGYHEQYNTIIIMISSSVYPEDNEKAMSYSKVLEYMEKPLSANCINRIRKRFLMPEGRLEPGAG